jgi:hypothetical protein
MRWLFHSMMHLALKVPIMKHKMHETEPAMFQTHIQPQDSLGTVWWPTLQSLVQYSDSPISMLPGGSLMDSMESVSDLTCLPRTEAHYCLCSENTASMR